jgi:CRP-like cAMP-binding protein
LEFKACLEQVKKREMKEQVSFFKEFRIFASLRNNTVERIGLNSVPLNFHRGQFVYHQGTSATDGIYFIKHGEFEVTQRPSKNPVL